jgi:protein gp37
MAWYQTSMTCVSVYGALDDLQQLPALTIFANAGPMAMQQLQFYDTLASGGINDASALALAKVLESSLHNTYAGTYKTGVNTNSATAAMQAILQTSTKTVEDLSDAVNDIYTF